MNEKLSDESLKQSASDWVAAGEQIRERIRDLTLQALQQRKFDYTGFQSVMKSMTEGISIGAEKRGADIKHALAEAFTGMDQAFTKAAQAGSLAMKDLAARGKEFSDRDLKQGLEQMKRMEQDFLETARTVSNNTGGAVQNEWQALLTHAQRTGTDTGALVSQTMREFSGRMASTMTDTTVASVEAAREFGERFAQAASGFLSGMSEALKPGDKPKR
ncbi:MAG: DUF6781 family protein [Betaproteobacteria bacterium]